MNEVIGWVAVKEGQLKGGLTVSATKRDLLIGFDLIPLLGLDECEKQLVGEGIVITQARVAICDEDNRTCYSATYQDRLDAEILDYGANHHERYQTMMSMALYLKGYVPMTAGETETLHRFVWQYRDIAADGRRKTTAKRLHDAIERIFKSFGIDVVPIRITPEHETQPA